MISHQDRVGEHLNRLRAYELDKIKELLKPSCRILEVGGGSGFQAALISGLGCNVEAIDVVKTSGSVFPVKIYDGLEIPFPSETFDIVFSSNVLEHIKNPKRMRSEICRVLKPGGTQIHILPSVSWRLWSLLVYYPYLAGRAVYKMATSSPIKSWGGLISNAQILFKSLLNFSRFEIIPKPHGEYKSSLHELYYYRVCSWRRALECDVMSLVAIHKTGVFYTDYVLFPRLGLQGRKLLALVFGSSSNIFILAKAPKREPTNACL